jgi:hypothetical protein
MENNHEYKISFVVNIEEGPSFKNLCEVQKEGEFFDMDIQKLKQWIETTFSKETAWIQCESIDEKKFQINFGLYVSSPPNSIINTLSNMLGCSNVKFEQDDNRIYDIPEERIYRINGILQEHEQKIQLKHSVKEGFAVAELIPTLKGKKVFLSIKIRLIPEKLPDELVFSCLIIYQTNFYMLNG